MKINEAVWDEVKKAIELHTEKDQSITDINIKFSINKNSQLRNYMQFNITQYDRE